MFTIIMAVYFNSATITPPHSVVNGFTDLATCNAVAASYRERRTDGMQVVAYCAVQP